MAIPDFQSFMLPLLKYLGQKGSEVSLKELLDAMAKELGLSEDDLHELLSSGAQTVFANRVSWAKTYLAKAGLLESPRRGHYRITPRGRQLLQNNPERIDIDFLKRYPEFLDFLSLRGTRRRSNADAAPLDAPLLDSTMTPSELVDEAFRQMQDALAEEILQRLKQVTPGFFERVVVELLLAMGYGGLSADAGEAVGKTGDEGIDGVIKQDKLGLDTVYVQAKRWENTPVGRPVLMQFAGALQARKANKGVFITTSVFTEDAKRYAAQIGTKIVLVDGYQLAHLMIEHNVGVSTVTSYHVKRIDNDFFDEGG